MDPYVGAKSIAEGKLDAIGVARQFLADTEWVTKLMNGKEEDIRPCICCHNHFFSKYTNRPTKQLLWYGLSKYQSPLLRFDKK